MFKYFYKGKFILLILSSLLVAILFGCGTVDKMEYYDDTKSTELSEEVNGISLDATEDKVKEVLGKPDFIEKSEDKMFNNLIYGRDKEKPEIELQISDGKVSRYFFYSDKYSATKGITKGASKKEIIKNYGKSYYQRDETGLKIIGYFDKKRKVNIEFSLTDHVEGIMVSKID
ncbi:hypothetical protein [Priestia filamentosa]|uniref:hypothetical protein n=1 Tax=Priestia filamentosa TaxID=1402861 RepID=UPI000A081E79|nr:hypothetical protein [Priestia filamentosa]MDT3763557.1 hypothetical protein [Priestia filamentosa]OXS71946.1 hypothetical protein B1B01_06395 [Priestia filamentosa]WRU93993.1 hypothetical protein RYX51_13260 [Priestia filamentosa]SMF16243.1 hypothetical protein SAMN06296056_1011307 [Priestia filamentosa]